MSSAYKVKVMTIQEFAHYVSTECEWNSAIILTPALDIFVRIRPQQITQQSCKSITDIRSLYIPLRPKYKTLVCKTKP